MIVKTSLHAIILILFSLFAYSQENDNEGDLFSKAHWGVSVVPALLEKAHVYGERDKYHINTSAQPGLEVLFNHYYHFERNYSLVFSAGGGMAGNNFNYEIAKEMFNPPTASNISRTGSWGMRAFYMKVQAEMQINFKERQKKSCIAAAGLSVLYSIDRPWEYSGFIYFGGISSQNSQEYLYIDQMYDNGHKPWVNFHISGGHAWRLKRGDLLQAALKLNYSPVDFAVGIYNFHVGNQPEVTGEYKLSGSYIGLSLSYVFSRRRI